LADNATVNGTQIENIGFIFMAPETLSMAMLEQYDAKYILVFTTLAIATSDQSYYIARSAGFGDEGKWSWMARISGQARQRFIDTGFISADAAWTDETAFGEVSNQTGAWEWNAMGKNSTIYKLLSYAKQRWGEVSGNPNGIPVDETGVQPTYFKEAYFAGATLSPLDAASKYGGLIPIVALYEIDWQAYHNTTGQP
jgi:hypothetical protein